MFSNVSLIELTRHVHLLQNALAASHFTRINFNSTSAHVQRQTGCVYSATVNKDSC